MEIDDALSQQIRAHFEKLPTKLSCDACKSHHWEPRSLEEAFGSGEEKLPPVITIMCVCCGHL